MNTRQHAWMIDPRTLEAMQAQPEQAMGIRDRYFRDRNVKLEAEITRHGSVAVLRLDGVMARRATLSHIYWQGTAHETTLEAIEQIAADTDVSAILLHIDSPGGQAHGMPELAAAIAAAGEQKPVIAQVDGVAYSAAYYLASQCSQVYMHESDEVGSIGTLLSLVDYSKAYQEAGLERVAITNTGAKYKGMGLPGLPVTEEQRGLLQMEVDAIQSKFSAAVSSGRNLSAAEVAQLADGRTFSSADAVELGLVDGVQSLNQTLHQLKESAMSQSNPATPATPAQTAPQAATLAELKQAMPSSTAEFRESQIEAGATLGDALQAFAAAQTAEIESLKAEQTKAAEATAKQQAEAEASAKEQADKQGKVDQLGGQGVDPEQVQDKPAEQTSGQHSFVQLRDKIMAEENLSRGDATSQAVRRDPAAHEDYIKQYNKKHG